jgi:hypothetical protein
MVSNPVKLLSRVIWTLVAVVRDGAAKRLRTPRRSASGVSVATTTKRRTPLNDIAAQVHCLYHSQRYPRGGQKSGAFPS